MDQFSTPVITLPVSHRNLLSCVCYSFSLLGYIQELRKVNCTDFMLDISGKSLLSGEG